MDAKEIFKLIVTIVLFGGVAPVGGIWLRNRPRWQAGIFALVCFMTLGGLMASAEWGLTLGSVESYRGHAKGYHFYFNEALALMLCISLRCKNPQDFRWMPPGFWLCLLYVGLSFLSIVNAPVHSYVYMAALRWLKAALLFVTAYNFVRREEDLLFCLRVLAAMLLWEFLTVLKWKYIDGAYQVRGTFEHQNPLAMYTIMAAMVLLAGGLGTNVPRGNLVLAAYVACSAIVESTFSRAGLLFFGVGSVLVVVLSLLDKPTKRRLVTVAALALVGTMGSAYALKSVVSRFNDEGNQASGDTRDLMNAASRAMVRSHPLGIGWNNFACTINPPFSYGDVIDDWERERGRKVDPDYAKGVVESHYFLLLSETGWQGLGSYLLLIAVFLWWNARAIFHFRQRLAGWVSIGIAAGCFCNYVQSTLERVLTQPRNLMLWLILLGITARIESWRRHPEQHAARDDARPVDSRHVEAGQVSPQPGLARHFQH